jgi:hypothetical protein
MAIEDGAVLGEVLRTVSSVKELSDIVGRWESIRKERAEFIARESAAQVCYNSASAVL